MQGHLLDNALCKASHDTVKHRVSHMAVLTAIHCELGEYFEYNINNLSTPYKHKYARIGYFIELGDKITL